MGSHSTPGGHHEPGPRKTIWEILIGLLMRGVLLARQVHLIQTGIKVIKAPQLCSKVDAALPGNIDEIAETAPVTWQEKIALRDLSGKVRSKLFSGES